MDEESKIDNPIIVTISCSDEVRAQVTLNQAVVGAVFGASTRNLHFSDELGHWWMRVTPDEGSCENAKLAALAGMTFLASEQGVSDENWVDDVRLVVLGRDLETGLRPMRDLFVSLFPNAAFHGGRFGDASKPIWGEDFVGTDRPRGVRPRDQWFTHMLIDELSGLSVRAYNCLRNVGLDTIGRLVEHTAADLLKIPNFGKKCLEEVVQELDKHDLKLAGD